MALTIKTGVQLATKSCNIVTKAPPKHQYVSQVTKEREGGHECYVIRTFP
jgi:hypothetical protein